MSLTARTQSHNTSLQGPLWTCVYQRRHFRGQGCLIGGSISRYWTWRGCIWRIGGRNRRRVVGRHKGWRQIRSTRWEDNLATIIPQVRILILPQPIFQDRNSANQIQACQGVTDASYINIQIVNMYHGCNMQFTSGILMFILSPPTCIVFLRVLCAPNFCLCHSNIFLVNLPLPHPTSWGHWLHM